MEINVIKLLLSLVWSLTVAMGLKYTGPLAQDKSWWASGELRPLVRDACDSTCNSIML